MSQAGKYFSCRGGLRDYLEEGQLVPVLDEFVQDMERAGYSPATIRGYLRPARHVTWCIEHGLVSRSQLTLDGLQAFASALHSCCTCPFPEQPSANARSAMKPFLSVLQRKGVAPPAKVEPFAKELAHYDGYLREVRGLASETRASRLRTLSIALRSLMPAGRFDVRRLTVPAMNELVADIAEKRQLQTARWTADTLRSFCRYLDVTASGVKIDVEAVQGPRAPRYRPSSKALTIEQLRLLLRPLRGETPLATRDFAVLLLLARTGLRAGDVARLSVKDFDAREGTLCIRRNKSRLTHKLPLPAESRDAILEYVGKYRPARAGEALFHRENYPYSDGLTTKGVSAIVERAFLRAGIDHVSMGAHTLRHSLATLLVARKQPLKSVADVLIHKSIATTAVYTRLDRERLGSVARPWASASQVPPRSSSR